MIRRTRSEWLQLFKEHEHSSFSATDFCKNKGIDPKYFSLKKAKLKNPEKDSPFIEALAPIITSPELSLSWAGAEIHLPANTSPIWLAQFMRELVK